MFDAKDFKGNLTDGNYLIRKWQLLKPGPEPWTRTLDPDPGPRAWILNSDPGPGP